MPYEVVNTLKSKSVIRCVDAGTYTITLAALSANTALETVSEAKISDAAWSTTGYISVVRNSVPQMNLYGSGTWTDMRHLLPGAGSNNSTQSLVITINGGGTILLEVHKTASYNVSVEDGLLDH